MSAPGLFLGQVADFRFGKSEFWGIQLYAFEQGSLATILAGTECKSYEVTEVRTDNPGESDKGVCVKGMHESGTGVTYPGGFSLTVGMNLLIGDYFTINVVFTFTFN